jgi:hypothetical protein
MADDKFAHSTFLLTILNIPQDFSLRKLCEDHAEKLIHLGEAAGVMIAVVSINAFTKFIHRHVVHDLRKYGFSCIHHSHLQ